MFQNQCFRFLGGQFEEPSKPYLREISTFFERFQHFNYETFQ